VYSLLVWTGMDLLAKPIPAAQLTDAAVASVRKIRPLAYLTGAVIATTAASGAFVAGNDAGHAYNDWPLMAGRVIPEQIWDAAMGVRNFFENTATVQFDHRLLAYSTLASVGALHMASKRAGGVRGMPQVVRRGLMAVSGLVALQIGLGISTLMLYVPVTLGAAHQAGALALLTGGLYLVHGVRRVGHEALRHAAAAAAGVAGSAAPAAAAAAAKPAGKAAAAVAAVCAILDVGKQASARHDDA